MNLKTLIQLRDRELKAADPRSRDRIRDRKKVLLMCRKLRIEHQEEKRRVA